MAEAILNSSLTAGSESYFEFFCQLCIDDGVDLEAVGYCSNCDDYLCNDCFRSHRKPKLLRDHVLLNMEEVKKRNNTTPKANDTVTDKCSEHAKKTIKYYCVDHDILCCSVCVTMIHRGCAHVQYIPEASKNVLASQEYKECEKQLTDMMHTFTDTIGKCKNSSKVADSQSEQAIAAVQRFRKEVSTMLDKAENSINETVNTASQQDKQKLQGTADKCNTALNKIQTMNSTFATLSKKQQTSQLFITLKKVKSTIISLKATSRDVEKNTEVRKYSYEPSSPMAELSRSKNALGVVLFQD